MRLVLHTLDQKFAIEAMSSLTIGSDPSNTVYLPSAKQTESFAEIGKGMNPVIIFILLAILFQLILTYTKYGKHET